MYLEKWRYGIGAYSARERTSEHVILDGSGLDVRADSRNYERISIWRYWYLSVHFWILEKWFPQYYQERLEDSWSHNTRKISDNPLGRTYWSYYVRNYIIVPIVTGGMMLWSWFLYRYDGEYLDATFWWILTGFLLLNLFTILLSNHQYRNRI